jgi:threonine/homoserine/homoserine lactone efflux protein
MGGTMIDPASFLLFLGAALVIAVTPGPGIMFVAARTLAGGPAEGLGCALGTGLGGLVHVAAGALGARARQRRGVEPQDRRLLPRLHPANRRPAGAVALQLVLLGTISVVLNTAVDALVVVWAGRLRGGAARRPAG